ADINPGGRAMRVLSICHDHPEFTPAGTEIFAKAIAEGLNSSPGDLGMYLIVTASTQVSI
uniref:hypothetical protein n=1 Tax=Okeania sp. SIO2F4 TaxID=2607790 RepID=UPI0025CCAA9C